MDSPLFLHAAHQAREAFDGLRLASWWAIGLAAAVLVLTWRRLLAWVRAPDERGPAVVRWGSDDEGWYFEIARSGERPWDVETPSGRFPLSSGPGPGAALRPQVRLDERPVALLSGNEIRLRL